ncbi:MAG TPA: FAD-dependent oxidoreductase [Rhodothermales bacterium]|nr:FAD-dependent oxidoreductase [Rhodothermales bacterium]
MNRRKFIQSSSFALAGLPFVNGPFYHGPQRIETQILIYGGGASGICAAIQAARMGMDVTVIENTMWIGGMLTSAGVSALDGNKYGAGGGLVAEFRDYLIRHYGGEKQTFTGWISLYCYEPKIGHDALQSLVKPLPNLKILYEADVIGYAKAGSRDRKITVRTKDGQRTEVICQIFMDCTEYGDGMKLAGVRYRLGREAQHEYEETAAPLVADMEMQDLTYAATLVKTAEGKAMPFTALEEAYWDNMFRCSTQLDCYLPDLSDKKALNHTIHTWQGFITYATLPKNKYLLNWPHHSNDYAIAEAFFEDLYYRNYVLQSAKLHTLQFVKYMQNRLGHPEWQLATDEYPTKDHLPMIPYIRESRRMVNQHVLRLQDMIPVKGNKRAPFRPDAIAVGDYFIDHHHAKSNLPIAQRLIEDYPDNGPFQIPPSVFFPENGDDSFMVGEKSIAVTHIVNGCTRLQPAVMLMGQAMGAIAAHALQKGIAPAQVPTPLVQETLIGVGCQLYILYDIPKGHTLFSTTQKLALKGVLNEEDALVLEAEKNIPTELAQKWSSRAKRDILKPGLTAQEITPKDLVPTYRKMFPASQKPITKGAFLGMLGQSLQL